jgi:hypothetical protein
MDVEIVGYIATIFILASLSLSNLKLLRIVNSIGGASWIVYGAIIGSSSIMIGNAIMILINIYKYYNEQIKK